MSEMARRNERDTGFYGEYSTDIPFTPDEIERLAQQQAFPGMDKEAILGVWRRNPQFGPGGIFWSGERSRPLRVPTVMADSSAWTGRSS